MLPGLPPALEAEPVTEAISALTALPLALKALETLAPLPDGAGSPSALRFCAAIAVPASSWSGFKMVSGKLVSKAMLSLIAF